MAQFLGATVIMYFRLQGETPCISKNSERTSFAKTSFAKRSMTRAAPPAVIPLAGQNLIPKAPS